MWAGSKVRTASIQRVREYESVTEVRELGQKVESGVSLQEKFLQEPDRGGAWQEACV